MSDLVAPTAAVSQLARIGERVRIGHATIVYDDVEIGDDVTIGDFCVIGVPTDSAGGLLRIGVGSTIRSHAVVYQGAELAAELQTGHHVLIRENARVGANLRLGSYSSLEGELDIGDYVRIHGYVHVGQGSSIRDFVWLYSLVTCANDPLPPSNVVGPCTIGAGTVVALNAQLLGCTLGDAVFVSAGALVQGEVPDGQIVLPNGSLGGPVSRLIHLPSGTRHPWFRHLEGHYPPEAQPGLDELRRRFLPPA